MSGGSWSGWVGGYRPSVRVLPAQPRFPEFRRACEHSCSLSCLSLPRAYGQTPGDPGIWLALECGGDGGHCPRVRRVAPNSSTCVSSPSISRGATGGRVAFHASVTYAFLRSLSHEGFGASRTARPALVSEARGLRPCGLASSRECVAFVVGSYLVATSWFRLRCRPGTHCSNCPRRRICFVPFVVRILPLVG